MKRVIASLTIIFTLILGWFALTAWAQPQSSSAVTPEERRQAARLLQAKDWANAVKAYTSIAEREPQNARAWNLLGIALSHQGEAERSLTAFQRAAELGNSEAMYNLACAYAKLKDKDRAFIWLDKAAQNGFQQFEVLAKDEDLTALRDDARFQAVTRKVKGNAQPCSVLPEARQFDFWIGEWEVRDPQGQLAGNSSVQLILGECVIFENWTPTAGASGKSFNVFNKATGKWQQTWVDSRGAVMELRNGEYKDNRLTFYDEKATVSDKPAINRLTFVNLSPERVRQLGESSTDGGKTWATTFDLTYLRKSSLLGTWELEISVPPQTPAKTAVTFSGSETQGTFVDQNGHSGTWKREGRQLTWTYTNVPNLKNTFVGTLSEDGKTISGANSGNWQNQDFKGTWRGIRKP